MDDLGLRFRVYNPMLGSRSRFNVAPSDMMPVIIRREQVEAVSMRWGLIACGADAGSRAAPHINARAETIAERPAFRHLLASHRCLVPASGFYEWKREGTRKTPFYLHVKDTPVFAFAGFWDAVSDRTGVMHYRYTIITTGANDLLRPVHDRMPVILDRENEDRWISEDALSREDLEALLAPYPSERMEMYPVSPRVNSPHAADDPRMILPLPTL